jgi:signal transduction histidine kinase
VDAIREAAETINLCIGHQRNIVDDILNYSKLDASMLALVPKLCEPNRQLAKTLRMFEPEFRKRKVEFAYVVDNSYVEEDVSWVMADLARIGQVLVNLVSLCTRRTTLRTNASQR